MWKINGMCVGGGGAKVYLCMKKYGAEGILPQFS